MSPAINNKSRKTDKHHTSFRFAKETIATLDLLVMKLNRLHTRPKTLSRTEVLELVIRYSERVEANDLLVALYHLQIKEEKKLVKIDSK